MHSEKQISATYLSLVAPLALRFWGEALNLFTRFWICIPFFGIMVLGFYAHNSAFFVGGIAGLYFSAFLWSKQNLYGLISKFVWIVLDKKDKEKIEELFHPACEPIGSLLPALDFSITFLPPALPFIPPRQHLLTN